MKSSISIDGCLSAIGKASGPEEEGLREAIKASIRNELLAAIRKARLRRREEAGRIVVHIPPRRFQFYGQLGIFTEDEKGEYKLNLSIESWIISDRNMRKNEFSVLIE
jgi:hypothetical protein